MAPTIPCRYYALGHCSNGSKCPYLHVDDQSQRICQFYLQGNCRFGAKCQLLHSKPKKLPSSKAKSSIVVSVPTAAFSQIKIGNKWVGKEEETLCKFSKEECKFGNMCKLIHGVQCPSCFLYVLHPSKPSEEHLQEHIQDCRKKIEAEKRSANMECAVCLELIRKDGKGSFGLLTCQHCVCYTCITQWRENDTHTMANSKLCPICRSITRFIVPSTIWPFNDDEKEEITKEYKQKLAKIDCRVYNYGQGSCPFGTSCFYKHIDEYGVSEKEKARILSSSDFDDNGLRIMKAVQLFDYLKDSKLGL